MGNVGWFAKTLPPLVGAGESVVEVGAGLGELAHTLTGRGLRIDALDRCPKPASWPRDREWYQTDVESFAGWHRYPVVMGNLILHQFPQETLSSLGAHWDTHARLLVFCEPARRKRSQHLFAVAAPLIGANHVSRHDGHVSIAAGFLDDELPAHLGLNSARWRWEIQTTFFGAYRLIARRLDS